VDPVPCAAPDIVDRRRRFGDQISEPAAGGFGQVAAGFPQPVRGQRLRPGSLRRPARGAGRAGRPDAGADGLPVRVQCQAERGHRDDHRVAGADLAELLWPGGGMTSTALISSSGSSALRFTPV